MQLTAKEFRNIVVFAVFSFLLFEKYQDVIGFGGCFLQFWQF